VQHAAHTLRRLHVSLANLGESDAKVGNNEQHNVDVALGKVAEQVVLCGKLIVGNAIGNVLLVAAAHVQIVLLQLREIELDDRVFLVDDDLLSLRLPICFLLFAVLHIYNYKEKGEIEMQKQQQREISLVKNQLEFKQNSKSHYEGVELDAKEKEYLLPHFLMLLIGKPGSGKTTLLKQLMQNEQMYRGKFHQTILVSPSHSKMTLPHIKPEFRSADFSLEWIFQRFAELNNKQHERIFGHSKGGRNLPVDMSNSKGRVVKRTFVLGDEKSRFFMGDFMKKFALDGKLSSKRGGAKPVSG